MKPYHRLLENHWEWHRQTETSQPKLGDLDELQPVRKRSLSAGTASLRSLASRSESNSSLDKLSESPEIADVDDRHRSMSERIEPMPTSTERGARETLGAWATNGPSEEIERTHCTCVRIGACLPLSAMAWPRANVDAPSLHSACCRPPRPARDEGAGFGSDGAAAAARGWATGRPTGE
eukprot:7025217-Prymnesium_polylepis.3